MMSLAQAASFFDRTPILDPDNGIELFKGQIDPYDDSKRDAGAAYRRVLSVAPGTALPARRAVRAHGRVWITGKDEQDGLAEPHREKYVLQPAEAWSVSRLASFLAGTGAAPVWAAVEWIKDLKEVETSSQVATQYSGIFAEGFDLRLRDIVWRAGEAYFTRAVRPLPSGYLGAHLVRIDWALAPAAIQDRSYDPVSGAYANLALQTVNCLRLRWQDLFSYESQMEEKYRSGDDVLVVPAATTVSTTARITAYSRNWSVLAVESVDGVKSLHLRPA